MLKKILALAALMACCNTVFGLYFHMAEIERKCFIEDLPDDTTFIVHYKLESYDSRVMSFIPPTPGIGMHVEVRDSIGKIILTRVYPPEARLLLISKFPGEHVICMQPNSTARLSDAQFRVHLDIQVGEHAIDYARVAQLENLTNIELRMRQLLDQVDQIKKEQSYQRYREDCFRQTNKSINSRILWWSVVEIIVVICVTFWQWRYARKAERQRNLEEFTKNAFKYVDEKESLLTKMGK